ncbi:MAG TPA: hypothetical protein PLL26_03790 [Candidatus Dojkabacteria bacterium]|nr:hypothetical protein [Candidatus Dojkabacteria bacterium]
MAYRPKKTTKKAEIDVITVEEPSLTLKKEEIMEIKDEAAVVVEKEIISKPVVDLADQNQEIINKLKEKLMNGTITDGEAEEYRMLINK